MPSEDRPGSSAPEATRPDPGRSADAPPGRALSPGGSAKDGGTGGRSSYSPGLGKTSKSDDPFLMHRIKQFKVKKINLS